MELTESELFQIEEADEHGVRLEMMAGQPFWEFQPNFDHQDRIAHVWMSVRRDPEADSDRGCYKAMDVGIRFPDDDTMSFRSGRTIRLECGCLIDV